jgi:hypothetical protein
LRIALDGVDLPVTDLPPLLDLCRPLRDVPLAGKPPSRVVAAVALPSLLHRLAQMPPQFTAGVLVLPDVQIDRLVADREQSVALEPPRYLLGAPVRLEQLLDE